MKPSHILSATGLAAAGVAAYDLVQKKHAILRNFPLLGHARYALELIGPELRQYIVTSNDQERPFSRDQRSWVYASAKLENNYFGFGSDNNLEYTPGYPIVKHRIFAQEIPPNANAHGHEPVYLPGAKVIGAHRDRPGAFRPRSAVNISAMSYGSLSGAAITALNEGARLAGCLHNTGEGGLSPYHQRGGDLIYQIGTGYFGCRDAEGNFSMDALVRTLEGQPVRMIEIKLSQGAKPGLGGMLPAEKVTEEIAAMRGIEPGQDCASPSRHSAFGDVDSMLDFVESVAERTGLPVGIKSAVGDLEFWENLAEAMADGTRGVDFITIDGAEGGTGAAPMIFADAVAYPLRLAFAAVRRVFERAGIAQDVTWIASGKVGLPENALVAFALGADQVNIAREAMLAIGCIQAQRCHTGHCPTGVATQNPWLERGLDPASKSVRLANYVNTLRRDLIRVSEAVGVAHPALLSTADIDLSMGQSSARSLTEVYGYERGWGMPDLETRRAMVAAMEKDPYRETDEENA